MEQPKKKYNEIEASFDAIEKLQKVNAPENLYDGIAIKMEACNSVKNPTHIYLKYAAIGLLVLVNALSYRSYQQQLEYQSSSEYQLSDLAIDYELTDDGYSQGESLLGLMP